MVNTSKDINKDDVVEVTTKQPGFMTYAEAMLQMKHGHHVRRASWPVDMHMVDGKIVNEGGPIADAEDPDHDPADSNPDQTRQLVRAAAIAAGKKPEKKRPPAERENRKSVEKEDKASNDWTFWFPKDARTAG